MSRGGYYTEVREGLAGRQTRFISPETLTSEVMIQSTPGQMLHGPGDTELRQKIAKVKGEGAARLRRACGDKLIRTHR